MKATSVVESITDWIEDVLVQYGTLRVLAVPSTFIIGLTAFGFGSSGFNAALALVLSVICAIVLIILLSLRVRQLRRRASDLDSRLTFYAKALKGANPLQFDIAKWKENVAIAKGGDMTLTRQLRLRFPDEPQLFCWSRLWSTAAPTSDRDQRKVKFGAANLNDDDTKGAPLTVSSHWIDNKHEVFVHFDEIKPIGSEFGIVMTWNWPRFSAALLEGGSESFDFTLRRVCEDLSITVQLDKSCKLVSSQINLSTLGGAPRPTLQVDESTGMITIGFASNGLPIPQNTPYGFRVGVEKPK